MRAAAVAALAAARAEAAEGHIDSADEDVEYISDTERSEEPARLPRHGPSPTRARLFWRHQSAGRAWDSGFYGDLVMPYEGAKEDNNLRRDTSLEKLGKLKPVFDRGAGATMTAGNSTPLTDGAAAVLLASEDWARARGLPVLAYLRYGKVAAVEFVKTEGLLMAPAYAVSAMLRDAGLGLGDFDLYEIHEAFAAQTLATLQAWEDPAFCRDRLGRDQPLGRVDRTRLNSHGGSLAIGHPFAATGARILGTLAKSLNQKGGGRGLISICTAGGMGVTAIVER